MNAFLDIFKKSAQILGLRLFALSSPFGGINRTLRPMMPGAHICLLFLLATLFFPKSSLRERGTAKMIDSMRSIFWVLRGPCAVGLVGIKCCPGPSGIRKSGMSWMAIHVTAVRPWENRKHVTESLAGPKQWIFFFNYVFCVPSPSPGISPLSCDFWFTRGWICFIHIWYGSHRKTPEKICSNAVLSWIHG